MLIVESLNENNVITECLFFLLPFTRIEQKLFSGFLKRGPQGYIAKPDNKMTYCFNNTCNINVQDILSFFNKLIKTIWIPAS